MAKVTIRQAVSALRRALNNRNYVVSVSAAGDSLTAFPPLKGGKPAPEFRGVEAIIRVTSSGKVSVTFPGGIEYSDTIGGKLYQRIQAAAGSGRASSKEAIPSEVEAYFKAKEEAKEEAKAEEEAKAPARRKARK